MILNFYIYTLLPYDMMKIHIISHDKTITYVLFCAADPLEGMIGSCRLKKKIQELKQAKFVTAANRYSLKMETDKICQTEHK